MFKKALSLLLALMLVVASVSITAISVSAADGDEGEPDTSTWYVVGNNADLLGKAWAADEANAMTLGEDGKYTKVYTDVAPTTGGDPISIKVMNTVDWIGNKYGKNIVFEIDETTDVTVTFDPNLVDATQVSVSGDHVKMHEFNPGTVEQMAAVGQGQGGFLDDEGWNLNANIMTEEAPGVYTIEYEDVDAAQMQFKFAANGSWTDNFGATDDAVKVGKDNVANYDGGNIYFNVNEDGSKVKLTLDMSNFDYESCTGATYKVQVWGPDGEEVVDAEDPTEEPTEAPTTEEPTQAPTEEPTQAPTQAPAGDKLTVTAKSNIAPTFTQTFDPDTEQITVTWWIQSEETMINAQWIMKYDNTVLKVDETPGVNMTFNKNGSVKKNMIFRATDGVATVTNMAPKSLGGSGINCNASNAPTGYMLVDEEDEESRIPFISVTFNPLEGAKGETTVELDVQIMQTQGPDDAREDYFINDSVIVDDTIKYLPESPVAVYAGPIDPDYVPEQQPEQPTTVAPTEAPTTEEPTEAPTTVAPTTVAPTEEPTQAPAGKHLTVNSTSNFFQDNPSKTWVDGDIPSQVTVEYYIDTPDKYQAVNGQFYMYYDPNVLQFNEKSNSKRGKTTVMPIADSVVCTYNWKENAATFNFSDAIPGDYLTEEDGTPIPVVRLVFDVVGEGDTTVNLDVYKLTLKDFETETDPDTWYEFNGTKPETDSIRQMVTENAKVYTVILPEPTVVPTQAPTEAPTTVAPTTEAPTTVAPTTVAPTTEAPTTVAPTTAAQTAVITVDTKVDGTHVTELPKFFGFNGETPVTANVGDTLTFAWKLDTDSKPVEAIQWIANFPASLEVDSAITAGTAMPQITTGAELNCKDGVVMANASNIDGYTVDPSANYIVISAKVVEAGDATVTMTLDELKFKETQEPTTAAPTEAPTTVAPTEAPTTVAPTEAPTTAAPTEAPTEAPTTAAPTEAPTEAPTTAAPTEEPTQAPTEAPTTAVPTEEPTTAPVEPTTAEPTTAPVEPTTVAPATDPTSATVAPTTAPVTTKPATSDTATPSNAGGNTSGNGAVQTGTASMALIILLVLVSGTAAIFFARRRERK